MEAQQIISLLVGISSLIAFFVISNRWVTGQFNSARAEARSEIAAVEARSSALIAQVETRLKSGIDSESKSRHDFANSMHVRLREIDTAISRQGERFDTYVAQLARRDEVAALEQRVIARIDKSDAKLDKIMEIAAAISATIPALEKKVDLALSSRMTEG